MIYIGPCLQTDADYWLLSDAGVSITDMWETDGILKLNRKNVPSRVFALLTSLFKEGCP